MTHCRCWETPIALKVRQGLWNRIFWKSYILEITSISSVYAPGRIRTVYHSANSITFHKWNNLFQQLNHMNTAFLKSVKNTFSGILNNFVFIAINLRSRRLKIFHLLCVEHQCCLWETTEIVRQKTSLFLFHSWRNVWNTCETDGSRSFKNSLMTCRSIPHAPSKWLPKTPTIKASLSLHLLCLDHQRLPQANSSCSWELGNLLSLQNIICGFKISFGLSVRSCFWINADPQSICPWTM